MDLEQIKLPEDARQYVTSRLMRVNLANHAVKDPRISTIGRGLFAALLTRFLKTGTLQKRSPLGPGGQSTLPGQLKKTSRK